MYIIGALILIYEIGFGPNEVPRWTYFSFAALALLVPWFNCLRDSIKKIKTHGWWLFGLIAASMVIMPFYLMKQTRALNN